MDNKLGSPIIADDKLRVDAPLSFDEITKRFINKFGYDWCSNIDVTESVVDTFIDYLMSMPIEQFDYKGVNNLKCQ